MFRIVEQENKETGKTEEILIIEAKKEERWEPDHLVIWKINLTKLEEMGIAKEGW